MKVILLTSGGYDSTYLAITYKKTITDYVYIDYGQKAKPKELTAIKNTIGKPITIIKMEPIKDDHGFFPARNLKFMLCLMDHFSDDLSVLFGNTANDYYKDNTPSYLSLVETLINSSYEKTLRIISPLKNTMKKDIVEYVESFSLRPYFCDSGEKEPCGMCHSCTTMKEVGAWQK